MFVLLMFGAWIVGCGAEGKGLSLVWFSASRHLSVVSQPCYLSNFREASPSFPLPCLTYHPPSDPDAGRFPLRLTLDSWRTSSLAQKNIHTLKSVGESTFRPEGEPTW